MGTYFLNRDIENRLVKQFVPNKVLVLIGPRRVGKTVLIQQILKKIDEPYLLLNGEDMAVQEQLARRTVSHYNNILQEKSILVIDEAQAIPGIGSILKLMVDSIEGLRIMVSGSSAFDMENRTGEPLTGRKNTFKLFTISENEFNQVETIFEKKDHMHQRLVFGNYPELLKLNTNNEKTAYLNELVNSYLLKDILAFENIQNADKILRLLRLIAFQVGSEVSLPELGNQLNMSKNTVEKYLDLLSKVYVIHKVEGFSRNLRKEVSKSSKWYFFDNGIRNILVANMNPITLRDDVGKLWENYVLSERLKHLNNVGEIKNTYFWRTYDRQEIDWIEESGGSLSAFEIKWNSSKKVKTPIAFAKGYPDATFKVITPENYLEWVGAE